MRENREGMKGRSDSISQAYARRRTSVSTHLLSPGMWVNVRRDAMTPVPLDSANVGPTFSVKELNSFDQGLDLVQSQIFKGTAPKISSRFYVSGQRDPASASDGQLPWRVVNFSGDKFTLGRNCNWRFLVSAGYIRNEPDALKFGTDSVLPRDLYLYPEKRVLSLLSRMLKLIDVYEFSRRLSGPFSILSIRYQKAPLGSRRHQP
ncbi:hypothetical protein G5I_03378 [Acromyrmex echinatior]|uniref:Uncharacterized protein n=1 Tax=Acromyrmex echinatior TaxID=103372 RepID=F4WCU5_ACREC|nr:hypothetical protein G5I_03378 [Acromyrmex echinatior]